MFHHQRVQALERRAYPREVERRPRHAATASAGLTVSACHRAPVRGISPRAARGIADSPERQARGPEIHRRTERKNAPSIPHHRT